MRALSVHPPVLCLQGRLIVRAVFHRAWHLHDERGIVVTVTSAPYDGPMAIRVEGSLPATVRPGMEARLADKRLAVGTVSLQVAGARVWDGERPSVPVIDRSVLERDLVWMRALAGVADPAICRRTATLGAALRHGDEPVLRDAVRGLIGLGPGLTPAGDDVLCGVMVGLHVLRRRMKHGGELPAKAVGYDSGRYGGAADALSRTVMEEMGGRTTALSQTLLFWAARGLAVQPLLDVLWTLGSREPVEGVDALLAIGHTSGRDMLAGAALAAASGLGGQGDASLVASAQRLP